MRLMSISLCRWSVNHDKCKTLSHEKTVFDGGIVDCLVDSCNAY